MNEHHELKSRLEDEARDKRRRFYFITLVIFFFVILFFVSIEYADNGPKTSQINTKGPHKTTDAERFGFTHSWINPIYRKPSE